MHNIIKRFKESGGISVRKGQGRKPKLNNRDLRSLRRHCIKNRHSSISDITTWAQDYFGKPLSSTTIRSYIHKCQLKLYCAKRKPYVNSVQKRRRLLWARRHLGWTITQWKRVLWSDESVFQVFFGRNGRRVLRTKEEKDHPDCYQQQVQKPGSVMVWVGMGIDKNLTIPIPLSILLIDPIPYRFSYRFSLGEGISPNLFVCINSL